MSRTRAITLLGAEAALVIVFHVWRYLRHLASPSGPPKRSEVYRVDGSNSSTGNGEYRLRFLR